MNYKGLTFMLLSLLVLAASTQAAKKRTPWRSSLSHLSSSNDFLALCMDLWLRIDLVQAINVSPEQKREILAELFKSIELLSGSSDLLLKEVFRSESGKGPREALMLIQVITESLQSTFIECGSEHYVCSLQLLQDIAEHLITPIHIDANISA